MEYFAIYSPRAPIQYKDVILPVQEIHFGYKTILWLSYRHSGISYTGNMPCLYWIGPPDLCFYMKLTRQLFSWWLVWIFIIYQKKINRNGYCCIVWKLSMLFGFSFCHLYLLFWSESGNIIVFVKWQDHNFEGKYCFFISTFQLWFTTVHSDKVAFLFLNHALYVFLLYVRYLI